MMALEETMPYIDLMTIIYAAEQENANIDFAIFTQYENNIRGLIHYLYFRQQMLGQDNYHLEDVTIELFFHDYTDIEWYNTFKEFLNR